MNKKIIWTLLVFLSFLGNIKAITFKGGDVIDNVFILKVKENGEKEYKKGQFIVDEYNNYVYCLEPFVKVKTSSTYDIHEDNFAKTLGITDALWKKLNLISFYRYQYSDYKHNHEDSKWYYITQMLIWEAVSPNSNFYFTDTFNGNINTSLFQKEKEEIMYLVDTHEEIPKFTYPESYIGDTIEITDTKDILYRFNRIVGAEKKQENKLIIKLIEKNNTIAVRKINKSKAYLFTSSDSQNILKGREDFPVSASYNIKAKEVLGNIKIKKYGEIYTNNSYTKDVLQNIEFSLYDSNKIFLKKALTNNDGEIIFSNLKKGTYYIKETNTLNDYILDENYYKVTLSLNSNNRIDDIFLEFDNILKKGKLIIKKVDADYRNPLSNTEFIILKDEKIVYKGKTNKDGILEIDNLTLGLYTIKEIKASNGYNINEEEISIIITDKENYIEITNERLIDKEDYIEIPNIPNTNISRVEILLYFEDKNKMHKRDL